MSNFGELLQIVAFFPIRSGDEWLPGGSSAVVAHPPQGCVRCGFTNAQNAFTNRRGESPQPPSLCSIRCDSSRIALNTHTPAYWWTGDICLI